MLQNRARHVGTHRRARRRVCEEEVPFPASLKVQGNSDEVFTKSGLYVYPTKSEPTYFLLPLSLALGTLPLSVCLPLAGSRPLLDSLARSPALS